MAQPNLPAEVYPDPQDGSSTGPRRERVNSTIANEFRLGWDEQIDPAEWRIYQRVMQEARRAGVRFAFGGAFATAVYTGDLRNTKDFDFYIMLHDRPAMIGAITRAGLHDHFEKLRYDRDWIYRASADDVIVDAIWAMANQRAEVDELWLTTGPEVTIQGERVRAIPIEELIWSKLYVFQRDRTDWGDVFNLIAAQATDVDWNHLLDRLAEDAHLLAAALSVFAWLAPNRARDIPQQIWLQLELRRPEPSDDPELTRRRANLLDTRPWFRPQDR
jgi:hypothetical protein